MFSWETEIVSVNMRTLGIKDKPLLHVKATLFYFLQDALGKKGCFAIVLGEHPVSGAGSKDKMP